MNINANTAPTTSLKPVLRSPEIAAQGPVVSAEQIQSDWSLADENRIDMSFDVTEGASFEPDDAVQFPSFNERNPNSYSEPLTKGDIADGLRDFSDATFGESGTKGIIAAGSLAHLATGGEIEISQGTDGIVPGSEAELSFSREGATVSWGLKF